jgi:photosystem II stability/assembly factor-like uncharacterized protein
MPKNISSVGTTGAFTSKQGTVWIQPNGCGTPMQQIGCVQFDELAVSRGDTTSILCFNPNDRSRFYKVGETLTAPEDSEFDLMSYFGAQTTWLDWLYKQKCSYPLYVLIRCTVNGHGVPTGWERAISINGASATTYTLANMATRNEDNGIEATLTLKASPADIFMFARPKVTTHEVDYATGLFDITFAGDTNCGGPCGDPVRDCETGFVIGAVQGALVGAVISKMKTDCIGWEIVNDSAGDPSFPFLATDLVISMLTSLKTGYPRIIVVRGTLHLTDPAEIAFSDDGGVTWSNVMVGTTDEQIGARPNCLTQSENGDLWFVTTNGFIYTSQDNGAVWLEREAGVLMAGDDLQAVHFRDSVYGIATGENGKILVTQDGGEHWFLLPAAASPDDLGRYTPTSASIRTVTSLGRNWYIGTDGGELWRTIDFKTWYKIAFSGQLSGSIVDLQFYDGCTGVLLFNEGGGRGRVMYTIDGANFEPLETPPNNGLNKVEMLSETEFYIVGAAHNGHGLVLKGTAYPAV